MPQPKVTVICLCYNQAQFVVEALDSVIGQTYSPIELIIIDDASTDYSQQVISDWASCHPEVKLIFNKENLGNCKAFNRGLALATGSYVVDLAADDLLMPERVAEGVATLESKGTDYGVMFSDAYLVNVDGEILRTHHKRDKHGQLTEQVPEGDIYKIILARYFLCSPTIFVRKSVYDAIGGYNEELAYEDFDFWVRTSRTYKYAFNPKILVKKRLVPGSWSSVQYAAKNRQLWSTLQVCKKAAALNITAEENVALGKRLAYEVRQSIKNRQNSIGYQLWQFKRQVHPELIDWLYRPALKRAAS